MLLVRTSIAVAAAALALVAASPALSRPATTTGVYQVKTVRFSARAVVAEINAVRARHDLRPLRANGRLAAAADYHSRDMGRRGYFSHRSADGTSFWKRVQRFYGSSGYRYWMVGENLLWSSGGLTAEAVVAMWMKSSGHRANLLSRTWREVGLSVRRFPSAPGVFGGLDATIVSADFGARY